MGELNGIALQCRYDDQVRRIKMVLVINLPKQRALGEWFETSTNQSFMDFMAKDKTCPSAGSFALEVDKAVEQLQAAFAK